MPLTVLAGVIKNNTEAVSNDIERIDELTVEELAKLWRGTLESQLFESSLSRSTGPFVTSHSSSTLRHLFKRHVCAHTLFTLAGYRHAIGSLSHRDQADGGPIHHYLIAGDCALGS